MRQYSQRRVPTDGALARRRFFHAHRLELAALSSQSTKRGVEWEIEMRGGE